MFFFDEAHLLFDGASKAFMDQVQQVVRLVRSKGVGVFFVTQSPRTCRPTSSGNSAIACKHALRALHARRRESPQAAARTFPKTDFYDIEKRSRHSALAKRW